MRNALGYPIITAIGGGTLTDSMSSLRLSLGPPLQGIRRYERNLLKEASAIRSQAFSLKDATIE